MATVLIPLANGFEEIEAVTNIDVLRRAGIEVITAGVGSSTIKGDHGIKMETDRNLSEISPEQIEAVLLPGGMPGAENLKKSDYLLKLIKEVYKKGDLVAAICAAPMVLEEAGVLDGRKATSYPGFDKEMPSCDYQDKRVVIDGNIITGRGPGMALEFAVTVVEYLVGREKAEELKDNMLAGF